MQSENAPPPVKVKPLKEKKIGHRRVDGTGQTTYKKVGFAFLREDGKQCY